MPRLKLFKLAIARVTPFFLFALACSLSVVAPFPTPYSPLPTFAQTTDARKAEARRLMQQGIQQHQTSQFQAALNSWQQALQIYRELKNRGCVAKT